MPVRYFVPGGANSWSNTANWSASSGGPGGQSVPNADADVIFDGNSGSIINLAAGTSQCKSLVAGTFTGTVQGGTNLQITGSNIEPITQNSGKTLEWGAGMTLLYSGAYTITASRGSGSINFNGKIAPVGSSISLNGAAFPLTATWSLVNNLTTLAAFIFGAGTFNTNNYNITCNRFDIGSAVAKVVNLGSSLITITQTSSAAWAFTGTNATFNAGTSTIRFTGTVVNSISFIGGGQTYYNVELLRGTGVGSFLIEGSNTFFSFTDATGTAAHDINFQIGTTQTFQNFNVRGASTSARVRFTFGPVTLVKIGAGAVTCDFLNLGANVTTASPDNTWFAGYNSIGTGIGWVLRNPLGLLTMGVGG